MRTRIRLAIAGVIIGFGVLLGGAWWGRYAGTASPAPPASIAAPVASVPAHVTAAPPATGGGPTGGGQTNSPALPSPPAAAASDDPTASMPVLASRDIPDPANPGIVRKIRIVRAKFKYPLWRVEELVRVGRSGQSEALLSRNIMIADHAMIRLNDDADPEKLHALAASRNLTVRKAMKMPGCYLVSIADESADALPRLLAILHENKALIRYAEPDYVVHTQQTVPNDPFFSSLWGLSNAGRPGADISAPKAWELGTGDTQVVVAVIDTGLDYTHPDLAANVWSNTAESVNGLDDDGNGYPDDARGWNFAADNNNPMDGNSHGTHVSGTIGAIGNNGLGVVGVNWRCRILPLKFLDDSGSGTDSDAADAIHYVADLKQRGVNIRLTSNSWGGGDYTTTLRDAIREAASLGILFVAAAGNSGMNNDTTPFYPASYTESNIIAVAATDSNDGLASFSHYGAASVDLAAPGVGILSTTPGNNYGSKNGTSMATPHVAGVATLLWNAWPEARAEDVQDAILKGTDPLPALAGKTVTGGRLNAFNAFNELFRILHAPVENSINGGGDYPVAALIGPPVLTDTNRITLFWNADGSTNFAAIPLAAISNTWFGAAIPAQPEGTILHYWIQAVSRSNQIARFPKNAPLQTCSFTVVTPLTLTVTGDPNDIDAVTPPYGTASYPSGRVFKATAPSATTATNGMRWKCTGWTGSGSIPETGSTNTVTFALNTASALTWQWRHEVALVQTSRFSKSLNKTFWYADGAMATTQTATASVTLNNTNYSFIGWLVDGVRQPDRAAPAVNPLSGIVMSAPRLAEALYLPTAQDSNLNGLPDWWEHFHFGPTLTAPADDTDGDGFANRDEYLDRSNPQDPLSFPRPPVIVHTPPANPQPHPAPFFLSTTITDNFIVASAFITWSQNGETSRSNSLVAGANNTYTFTFPGPASNGNNIVYSLIASDLQGSTTNGPHTLAVRYPVVSLAPASLKAVLLPDTTRTVPITVTNSGGDTLRANLSILWGGLSNDMESGEAGWHHSGAGDLWTLSTNRSVSGTASWYCGNPATGVYGSSMHAKLDSPPIVIPAGGRLSFRHWIQCELDEQWWRRGWLPNNCWDGGIVEISTNQGATFQPITPVGGYPNLISGYYASPWPDRTPCFAGTGAWSQAEFDLSAFTGTVAVIRFHFGSDDNTEEEGWYLDDIRVSPVSQPGPWMSLATNAFSAPSNSCTLQQVIVLDSAGIPTGDRAATLWIAGNDPLQPWALIPVSMSVRSPALLTWVSASQTDTNGTGLVSFSNQVCDAEGDTCQMEFEWSVTPGAPWSNLWLTAVQSDAGTATFNNVQLPTVSNLITRTEAGLITNAFCAVWASQTSGCGLIAASNTLIRGRTWDGLFWSSWATSQPFMVDNEPPRAPTSLTSSTHWIAKWSSNPSPSMRWNLVNDGGGIGVKGYHFGCATNAESLTPWNFTTQRSAIATSPGDGTNIWIWARTEDAYGNVSPPLRMGPLWIDSTPPSPVGAVLSPSLSPFGPYLIGANAVTSSWSGFTENGTGIEGYYLSLYDGGGTTNGTWVKTPTGVCSPLVPDQTNTVYVWARDKIGWIGPAARASFLMLSPGGDWDQDGVPNRTEEIAGTDAARAASLFKLGIANQDTGTGNGFVIRWLGVTNRHYSVYFNDRLTAGTSWSLLPGCANIPGTNGIMSCSDPGSTNPVRFYKISISSP